MRPPTALRRLPFALRLPSGRTLAILTVAGVLVYLVVGPLTMLVVASLKRTEGQLPIAPGVPWTLENYARVLFRAETYEVLLTTLVYAAGALGFSFTVAVVLAWLIERTDLPWRTGFYVITVAALGMPHVIAGIAWALLANPQNGMINVLLHNVLGIEGRDGPVNVYSLPGLIFVQGIILVPITFLLVSAGFRAMNAAMEDAGSASGARFPTVLRRITLPMLTPALLSAFIYQFVTVIESFDVPLVIGLRGGITVLSTQIYIAARPEAGLPDYGLSSAYSLLLLLLALGPLLVYNRAISRSERFATVTGQDFQARRLRLGRWKVPALLFVIGFVLVAFVLPALVMVWTSLQPFYAVPSAESLERVTLAAYAEVLTSSQLRQAIVNTLIVGGACALGAMLLGVLVAWILVRTRSKARFALDLLAFMPHAMPGVIIGLSVLLIYLVLPVGVYGTVWIIVIALATQYVSLSTRLMSGSIAQIQQQLEDAAEASGASWGATLRRVVLPLVLPSFVNGFLLVFLQAIRNLTIALLLYAPGSVVLATLVYRYWDRAETAATAVVGVLMVVLTLGLSTVLRGFSGLGGAAAPAETRTERRR